MTGQRHPNYWQLLTTEGVEHYLTQIEQSPLPTTRAEVDKERQILEGLSSNIDQKIDGLFAGDTLSHKALLEAMDHQLRLMDMGLRALNREWAHDDPAYHPDWKIKEEVNTMAWRDSIDRAASEIGQRMAQEADAARETLAQSFDLRLRTMEVLGPRDTSQGGIVRHDLTQQQPAKAPEPELDMDR